jgi:hypothetical protein
MLITLGILFAVVPAVVWMTIARTRLVGFAIGGTLLAGAGLLVSVQQGWIDAPRPDAHLVFSRLCSSPAARDWKDGTSILLPRNGPPAGTERSASWGCSSPSLSWSAFCTR